MMSWSAERRVSYVVCMVLALFSVVHSWFEEEQNKPTFLTANVGEHVVFNCELDFPQDIPIPYILRWNKDGKSVFFWYAGTLSADEPFIGRINLVETEGYGKGSVNLTSIRESDYGWYQCRVLFPNRNPSSRNNGTWFYLTVNGGNLLEIPPINQTTLEGEEATFTCVAKDKHTKIVWHKDGVPIKELVDIRSRSWEADDGTLTIRETTMTDLGEYECEALSHTDKQTARAFLNVQFKAKVVYAPKEVYLHYGRPAILDCHFRSNPPLTNLRWEKDGFLFDPYNVQGVFYKRNGSLFFTKVDEAHSGLYSCTPYNDLGTDGPSTPTRVIVQRPPIFIVTPNNLYLKKIGENLEMPCDARDEDGSGHRPTMVWYKKDGSSLPEGRYSLRVGNITIEDIQQEDQGVYQCAASNEVSTIITETEVMVETMNPRAPYNLTANSTQSTVTLKWVAGYIRPDMEFSLWYRPVGTEEWRTIRIENRKKLEATVYDLNPGRNYEFMVLSKDHHGDGMFSKTIKISTKGPLPDSEESEAIERLAPIGPPRNVSVHLTLEGYLVTWEPPDVGRDSLNFYRLRWSEESKMDSLCGTVETKELSFNVKHLEEATTYYFQVSALSTNDYQATSDRVTLVVPAYKRVRAISMGIMGAVALLGIAFGVFYYTRKRCFDKKNKPHLTKDSSLS